MKKKILILPFLLIALYTIVGAKESRGPLSVYVMNYPLQYFAERIGGMEVKVNFPAPADVDPAFWTPKMEQVVEYQKADLILLNGAAYSKWTNKVSLPASRMVDTSASFADAFIPIEGKTTHSHGTGDHSHSGTAFTTWLDFSQAVKQAEAIRKAFERKRPESKSMFQKNYEALKRDLMTLDQQINEMLAANPKQPLLGSHPIYQYFARRYKLNLKMVMWEPDEFPSEEKWKELKFGLKSHKARWMIWEGEPLEKSKVKLQSFGVKSLVFDPCFNVPEKGNFLDVMKSNIENLKKVFNIKRIETGR